MKHEMAGKCCKKKTKRKCAIVPAKEKKSANDFDPKNEVKFLSWMYRKANAE